MAVGADLGEGLKPAEPIKVTEQMREAAKGHLERLLGCFRSEVRGKGTDLPASWEYLTSEQMALVPVYFGMMGEAEKTGMARLLNIEPREGAGHSLDEKVRIAGEWVYWTSDMRSRNIINNPETIRNAIAVKKALYGEPGKMQIGEYVAGFENKYFFPRAGEVFDGYVDRLAVWFEYQKIRGSKAATSEAMETEKKAEQGDVFALRQLAEYVDQRRITASKTQEVRDFQDTQRWREQAVAARALGVKPADGIMSQEMVEEREIAERAKIYLSPGVFRKWVLSGGERDELLTGRLLRRQVVLRPGSSDVGTVAVSGGEAADYYRTGAASPTMIQAATDLGISVEEVAVRTGAGVIARGEKESQRLTKPGESAKWERFKARLEAVKRSNEGKLLPAGEVVGIEIRDGGEKVQIPIDESVLEATMRVFGYDQVEEAVVTAMYRRTPEGKAEIIGKSSWAGDLRRVLEGLRENGPEGMKYRAVVVDGGNVGSWTERQSRLQVAIAEFEKPDSRWWQDLRGALNQEELSGLKGEAERLRGMIEVSIKLYQDSLRAVTAEKSSNARAREVLPKKTGFWGGLLGGGR